jgi:hypothetical protein
MRKRQKLASESSIRTDKYGYFSREVALQRMAEFPRRWKKIWEEISASGGKDKNRGSRTRRTKGHN